MVPSSQIRAGVTMTKDTQVPPTKKAPKASWLWRAFVVFMPWFTGWYNRMQVDGWENVPSEQPLLFCPNHPGLLDPVYMHIAILKGAKRWLRWLGWADLMNDPNPFFKWVVTQIGTITPINEDHGEAKSAEEAKSALGSLAKELKAGHWVGLFPEGANHQWGDVDLPYKYHTGAIRLASQTGVSIIPVAMDGTQRVWPTFGERRWGGVTVFLALPFWFPAKVKVRFGKPFVVDPAIAEAERKGEDVYPLLRAEAERLKEVTYALRETL